MTALATNEGFEQLVRESIPLVASNFRADLPPEIDPETSRLLRLVAGRAGAMLAALAQTNSVIEGMEETMLMLRSFPWRGRAISRTEHLDLHWFLFENLTYTFKEKIKLVFDHKRSAADILGLPRPAWIKSELSTIDRTMGQHIRNRGNTVHSWNVKNPIIDFFGMVEFFSSNSGESDIYRQMPGLADVKGHYQDAKREISYKAKATILEARGTLGRILMEHDPSPSQIAMRVCDLIDQIKKGQATLTERRSQ